MVLHNDKWKYKAKRDYMRKHGLNNKSNEQSSEAEDDNDEVNASRTATESVLMPVLGQEKVTQDGKNESEGIEKDDEKKEKNEVGPDSISGKSRRGKKLLDNNWRFENDLKNEQGLPKDPFELEEEERIKNEEIKQKKYQRELILNSLQTSKGDIEKDWDISRTKPKSAKNYNTDDLLNWTIDGSVKKTNRKNEDGNVKIMSEDERKEFYKIQENLGRLKLVNDMKTKLSVNANKSNNDSSSSNINRNVLFVDLKTDKDQYRRVLESTFESNTKKMNESTTTQTFDDDLNVLLGVTDSGSGSKRKEGISTQSSFDIDSLINGTNSTSSVSGAKHNAGNGAGTETVGMFNKPAQNDEDFLNDLIG